MYKILGIVYIILSLGLFAILLLPFDNIIYENNKIQTHKDEYRIGENVSYTSIYYKKFNLAAVMIKSVEIRIENEDMIHKISLKPRIGNIPAGHHHLVAYFPLPDDYCITGKATIVIEAEYSIFGGLRVIHDRVESNVFTITK